MRNISRREPEYGISCGLHNLLASSAPCNLLCAAAPLHARLPFLRALQHPLLPGNHHDVRCVSMSSAADFTTYLHAATPAPPAVTKEWPPPAFKTAPGPTYLSTVFLNDTNTANVMKAYDEMMLSFPSKILKIDHVHSWAGKV
jgi:hypothetical protein